MHRTRIALAGSAAITATALVAACSSSSSGSHARNEGFTAKITTTVAAATSPVSSITWNLPYGESTSLDPALSALESNSTVVSNLCESLMTQTTSGGTKPGLATSITQKNDRTYVIHLRHGVRFWDGRPMTAADVVYSIKRVLNPKTGSSWAGWASAGADVATSGPDQVTIRTKKPNALLRNFFATPAFAVVEKAYAQKKGSKFGTASGGVMCTGPYKLVKWSTGKDITITRNDGWWNTSTKPLIKNVKFTFTADSSAQVAALRSGSVDGSFSVPISSFKSLSKKGNLLFNRSYGTNFLTVLNLKGSLADVKTRQALQESIDYQGIVKSIYLGTADPLRSIVPPATWGYSHGIFQKAWNHLPATQQNIAKAKSLLKQSSYKNAPIVLGYPSDTEEQAKTATAIAAGANSVGLNVKLKPMQSADYLAAFSSAKARAGLDALLVVGYLDFPDPVEYLQYSTTGNYYNFSGYSNPQFDAIMKKAVSTLDDTKRAKYATQAQAILVKDYASIPLVSDHLNVYYSNKLAGLVPSPSYLYAPWLVSLGGK